MRAWLKQVTSLWQMRLGASVADDKSALYLCLRLLNIIISIKNPLLKTVPSFICSDDETKQHVLANLDKLVGQRRTESSGYMVC